MITWAHRQAVYVASAVMFLTRLRVPARLTDVNPSLSLIAPYFPLVGILVGGIGAAVFVAAAQLWPRDIAVLLSMTATILVTGSFHEDGLADVCDGFGGGWSTQKILDIMKDSRVGTFGTVGVLLILGLKYLALSHLDETLVPLAMISAHTVSRAMPVAMSHFLTNARDEAARVDLKPSFHNQTFTQMVLALVFGLMPLAFLLEQRYWVAVIPMVLTTMHMARFFKKWIGGYTGDCCGAVQQVTEVVFYLGLVALARIGM